MRYFEIDTALAAKKFGLPSTHRSLARVTAPCEQWCAFAERADARADVLIMATHFLAEGSILTYLACTSTEVAEKWEDGAIV